MTAGTFAAETSARLESSLTSQIAAHGTAPGSARPPPQTGPPLTAQKLQVRL